MVIEVQHNEAPGTSFNERSSTRTSFNEKIRTCKYAHRNRPPFKRVQSSVGKIKKSTKQSAKAIKALQNKRRRPTKDAFVRPGELSPRQQFALVFKPPTEHGPSTTMHPTQQDAEIPNYEEPPVVKILIEKLPENGVNGKETEAPAEVENEVKESNGHNHDIIDHDDEIVDVVAISEEPIVPEVAPVVPEVQEAQEAPVHQDNGNGLPEEPFLSPRLRGSAKKNPSSSRSSSPADSLCKEKTSRKLSYVLEVPVEEKLEVSVVADLNEPLIVEGGAEDLAVSPSLPEPAVEKSPAKPRTPVKVTSPRAKKTPKVPETPPPVEEEGRRRTRKPRSDEKKKYLGDSSPRASVSMMEDAEEKRGSGIRSVRARRPIRRSRHISALDSSLHNQSSPWDEEYKILLPSEGGVSLIDTSLANGDESPLSVSVSQKRKISEDDFDGKELKKAKNESNSSSFFSIVTSPICALKEKFRFGALAMPSSTPFHGGERKAVDSDASMLSAEGNGAEEHEEIKDAPKVAVPADVPAKSWCNVM